MAENLNALIANSSLAVTKIILDLRSGKISRLSWIEKERQIDIFDVKKDVIQTFEECGYTK